MPWEKIAIGQLAEEMGVDVEEVRVKQRLMSLIARSRKEKGITQKELGRIIGVSQGRIAQIESGVGTSKITYDVLFRALAALGKDCRVVVHTGGGKSRPSKVAA